MKGIWDYDCGYNGPTGPMRKHKGWLYWVGIVASVLVVILLDTFY